MEKYSSLLIGNNNPTKRIKLTSGQPNESSSTIKMNVLQEFLNIINFYFQKNMFCDISIMTDDGTEIRAHKIILAAASPYFSVFEIITGWIEYNKLERTVFLPDLLKHLRLSLIPNEELKKIISTPILSQHSNTLISMMNTFIDVKTDSNIFELTMRRTPYISNEPNIIFAIRSHLKEEYSYEEYLFVDSLNPSWKRLDFSLFGPVEKKSTTLILNDSTLFSIGGQYGPVTTSSVCTLELNSLEKKWKLTSNLLSPRKNFAVCTDGRYVYIVGGTDECDDVLNSVEYYDTYIKEWNSNISSMSSAKSYCSAISYKDRIYVFGGENCGNTIKDVEYYDFETKIWTLLDPMPIGKSRMSVTVIGNIAYFIGGEVYDFLSETLTTGKSAFAFNLDSLNWIRLPDLIQERSLTNSVGIHNDIFVFGGVDDEDLPVKICEKYISEKKEWVMVDSATIKYTDHNAIFINYEQIKNQLKDMDLEKYFTR
ncbi:kelch-like protein 2 isoform X2 [Daktulosphaira vitifoliae]|uniref:kelch-like protein 2 isoform X2 n=1 Tax=Daktulosphaira vitifoliae TaxID=58002 RepID=UPI0021AAED43|nr:kelch-like protein 2 isoform X2 [Daktulosphaira vitifoliae]